MTSWMKFASLLTLAGLTACSASPTGRNQLLLFSDKDMSQLGAQSFEQMKKNNPSAKMPKLTPMYNA